ncbi:hypothetical protein, partial [Silicimonas algicola]|uniref:hypothetical protein n=1 Tax=Silicimonas algicola TaxID=1826607 RepID=UPI003D15F8B3
HAAHTGRTNDRYLLRSKSLEKNLAKPEPSTNDKAVVAGSGPSHYRPNLDVPRFAAFQPCGQVAFAPCYETFAQFHGLREIAPELLRELGVEQPSSPTEAKLVAKCRLLKCIQSLLNNAYDHVRLCAGTAEGGTASDAGFL